MPDLRTRTKIISMEEKKHVLRAFKVKQPDGSEAVEQVTEPIGWYVRFAGSWESLYVGTEHPGSDWFEGQTVDIILRPVRGE